MPVEACDNTLYALHGAMWVTYTLSVFMFVWGIKARVYYEERCTDTALRNTLRSMYLSCRARARNLNMTKNHEI